MSSPPKVPKRILTKTVSFVRATNPEILKIQPRPGGVIPIVDVEIDPCEKSKAEAKLAEEAEKLAKEGISREFKVQTALDETESLESLEPTLPNPIHDAMYIYSVAISCLMMMAAGHGNVPDDYAYWTRVCLESVKDGSDRRPPNVQRLLNHIKYLEQSGKISSQRTKKK